jgi:hypothetical protein
MREIRTSGSMSGAWFVAEADAVGADDLQSLPHLG